MTLTRRCAVCELTFRQHRKSIKWRKRRKWEQMIVSGFRKAYSPCHNLRKLKLDARERNPALEE